MATADPTAKVVIDRLQKLKTARDTFEQHWQDLSETMLTRRADFTVQMVPGEKRTEKQFDSVPAMAAQGLASAVDEMLMPRFERWVSVVPDQPDLMQYDEVRLWLEDAEDRMHKAIYAPSARFLQSRAETTTDLVVLGTGVLFTGRREDLRGLTFRSLHLKNTYLASNADGLIDTAFLVSQMTARQAERKFGRDVLGKPIQEALRHDERKDEKFPFVERIVPRRDREPMRRDRINLPIASTTVDIKGEKTVREDGYEQWPLATPRWFTAAGEDYGRSPGMLALPDCKTAHELAKVLLKAGHLAVSPPLLAASDSIISGARTMPDGITYFDSDLARDLGRIPVVPLDTAKNVPLGFQMQESLREQIYMAFLRHVLNLPFGGPQMTATEVIERREEFVRAIGPVFGRLVSDYLAPMINSVFNIMMNAGAFAPAPEILQETTVHFEFRSPVERVRRQTEPFSFLRTMEALAPILPYQPDVMDNFNGDEIAQGIASANSVRPSWLRGPDDMQAIREKRQEEQALQAALAMAQGQAETAA